MDAIELQRANEANQSNYPLKLTSLSGRIETKNETIHNHKVQNTIPKHKNTKTQKNHNLKAVGVEPTISHRYFLYSPNRVVRPNNTKPSLPRRNGSADSLGGVS